jgi:hypothetical protein
MINLLKLFEDHNKQREIEENSDVLKLILSTSQKISTFLIDKNSIGAKMKRTSKKKRNSKQ